VLLVQTLVLENETLFDSRKFKDMNTEDGKLGSLMEECIFQVF